MKPRDRNMLRTVLAAGLVVAALATRPALSQSDGFKNTLEAYLMAAAMSGTLGSGQLVTDIDVPASQIFENLKFATLVYYRGETSQWAVHGDLVYMNLGASASSTREVVSADIGAEEFIADVGGAYRLSPSFELLAGARYTALQSTVKVTTPLTYNEVRTKKDWVDPFVGAQAFMSISKPLQIQLRGDIGGFDAGCRLTWQATVRLNWQVSRTFRLGLGYRWLYQDYETGSGSDYFKWDVLTQGPLTAAGITF